MREPQQSWHQLFGLWWLDFCRGTPIHVEPEKDLSHKHQLLDLVLARNPADPLPRPMPDGFADLAAYSLVSFKSHQEALDAWSVCELIGHYVNFRKQVSPSMGNLLPAGDFRLVAVSARYPRELARQAPLGPLQEGVYDIRCGVIDVRLVVIGQLPRRPHNAMLHLFSADEELVSYGAEHHQPLSHESSTLLMQMINHYRKEGLAMPETLEQFHERTIREMLQELPAERLLERLSPEERLKGLPAEERLKGLPAEERLKGLSPDELLSALSPEAREALARRLQERQPPPKPD